MKTAKFSIIGSVILLSMLFLQGCGNNGVDLLVSKLEPDIGDGSGPGFKITIENKGKNDVDKFQVKLLLSKEGNPVAEVMKKVKKLPASGQTVITTSVSGFNGSFDKASATADFKNEVAESNEENNTTELNMLE